MKNRGHHEFPPMFDLNNLDEDHEIQIERDAHGNIVRIRKVKRWEGCTFWLFVFALAALAALGWYFFHQNPSQQT